MKIIEVRLGDRAYERLCTEVSLKITCDEFCSNSVMDFLAAGVVTGIRNGKANMTITDITGEEPDG